MKKIYVYVGFPKCASTSFQLIISRLSSRTFTFNPPSIIDLLYRIKLYNKYDLPYLPLGERLVEELHDVDFDTILISDENLIGWDPTRFCSNISFLMQTLRNHFDAIFVVVLPNTTTSYLSSVISELLRSGNYATFADFLSLYHLESVDDCRLCIDAVKPLLIETDILLSIETFLSCSWIEELEVTHIPTVHARKRISSFTYNMLVNTPFKILYRHLTTSKSWTYEHYLANRLQAGLPIPLYYLLLTRFSDLLFRLIIRILEFYDEYIVHSGSFFVETGF